VQWLSSAGRAIGLREHGANPVRLSQRVERRDGELRRAGEAQP
jgi:hypothetical protein